jgi:DNA-binding NtrC family response regulator
MLTLAQTYAPEEIPVLILGETGSGKDLVARGIHDLSGRSGRFVPVNCAAAQRHLFAAELFGARKGAYTGAIEHRQGLIQEAEKGTLFFDEIADLDAEAQGFLLRFLDSGEVRPLGSTKWTRLEVRILAATCRDLRRRASQGLFREDLYARMAAVVLRVPPLRDRLDDLVPLLWMFWERMGGTQEERETVFTPEMLERLKQYPWPGNVRDLRHLVALAIPLLRAQGAAAARIHVLQWAKRERLLDRPADHPAAVRDTTDTAASGPASPGSAEPRNEVAGIPHIPPEALGRIISGRWTADTLQRALEAAEGNIPAAARALGVSRSQAYRLYRELRESLG